MGVSHAPPTGIDDDGDDDKEEATNDDEETEDDYDLMEQPHLSLWIFSLFGVLMPKVEKIVIDLSY
jgi:hypothetical protein